MWCILPHAWILHLLLRFKDPIQLGVKSYISDRLIRKSQYLASYVSHHNAMAYDIIPRTKCYPILDLELVLFMDTPEPTLLDDLLESLSNH